ncbi:uncharacterized protein [Dermacentor albipictus]|uniref:uncharacterized protein isoform X1 n=1 Tax=Dermacentor albipictus TaxID=60249 RepID=UPI0038FCAC30
MCICETAFEVTMLASFCMLQNGLHLLYLITREMDAVTKMTGIVVFGVFVATALILLVGVMTGNKTLVDTFVFLAKVRVLFFCLALFFVSFLVFKGDSDSRGAHTIIGTYGFDILLTKLAEKSHNEQFKLVLEANGSTLLLGDIIIQIAIDVFVIYRIGVFSDRMG